MTEFTSADGLSRMRETKRKRYLTYYEDEHPISAQLFGSQPRNPRRLRPHLPGRRLRPRRPQPRLPRQARRRLQRRQRPAARPPANRAHLRSHPRGRHHPLHRQVPHGLERQATSSASSSPSMAEDCGLNAVALHARTREDGYTGNARWEYIAAVKDAVTHPRHRQRRHPLPRRRRRHGRRHPLRRRHDRPRRPGEPLDLPPDRPVHRHQASHRHRHATTSPTEMDRYRMIRDYFERLDARSRRAPRSPRPRRRRPLQAPQAQPRDRPARRHRHA